MISNWLWNMSLLEASKGVETHLLKMDNEMEIKSMIRRVEDVRVPLIIPAYEPDDRMLILLEKLRDNYNDAIVIVNDGSGEEYSKYYFAAENYGFTVLKHYKIWGKEGH